MTSSHTAVPPSHSAPKIPTGVLSAFQTWTKVNQDQAERAELRLLKFVSAQAAFFLSRLDWIVQAN